MGALGDLRQYAARQFRDAEAGSASARPFLGLPGIRVACFPPYDGTRDNPYLSLCYEHLAEAGFVVVPHAALTFGWLWRWRRHVTLLHFQWQPDWYYLVKRHGYADPAPQWPRLRSCFKLAGFGLRLRFARILGYRVVWTIHEVFPPPTVLRPAKLGRGFDRVGQRILAAHCHALVAHHDSIAGLAAAEFRIDRTRIHVIPHGPYFGQYAPGRSRSAVRAELGIEAGSFVFLAFGTIRPDKALGTLLDAFRALPNPRAALVVAGRVEDVEGLRLLETAAREDPRIKPLPGFVPDAQVRELFDAADASVLARGEEWTSGSVVLALSLGVPVVCARLAAHEELLDGGAAWLFDPEVRDSLRTALADAAASSSSELNVHRLNAATAARRLPTWEVIAEQLAAVMREAIGSEERLDELSARVWPLLEVRSPLWKVFPASPQPAPPAAGLTEQEFVESASRRAAAARGS
jgi:glycosyltransferase involved in cell wall biosynthesis